MKQLKRSYKNICEITSCSSRPFKVFLPFQLIQRQKLKFLLWPVRPSIFWPLLHFLHLILTSSVCSSQVYLLATPRTSHTHYFPQTFLLTKILSPQIPLCHNYLTLFKSSPKSYLPPCLFSPCGTYQYLKNDIFYLFISHIISFPN